METHHSDLEMTEGRYSVTFRAISVEGIYQQHYIFDYIDYIFCFESQFEKLPCYRDIYHFLGHPLGPTACLGRAMNSFILQLYCWPGWAGLGLGGLVWAGHWLGQ